MHASPAEEARTAQGAGIYRTAWDLDRVPAGTYQLDWSGRIARCAGSRPGAGESRLLDRDLFGELAPCPGAGQLKAAMQDGVAAGRLDLTVLFDGAAVTLFYSAVTQQAWVFVKRI